MAFWAAIPAIISAVSAAAKAAKPTPTDGVEAPPSQFGQTPPTSEQYTQPDDFSGIGTEPGLNGVSGKPSATAFEKAISSAMGDDTNAMADVGGGAGGGFADIMSKIAMGAKVAGAMTGGGPRPGPVVNFGGAAHGGFGGTPVSQGFISAQKKRNPSFGQLAQRLRR